MNGKNIKNDTPFLLRDGWLHVISSVICILLGLIVGYIVLLCINPAGANAAILAILKNFFYYTKPQKILYYLGSTLVKSTPLILCSLSIIFSVKAGMFNIGASGQYSVGAGAALFCAIKWNLPWYVCLIVALLAGAVVGMITGLLKAYCKVNEVISGIMLNWIALYLVNDWMMIVKSPSDNFTKYLSDYAPDSMLPTLGIGNLFGNNIFMGVGLVITPVVAIFVYLILCKTRVGYELKATGYNSDAAFYAGIKEKRNIVLALTTSGCIAGLAAGVFYLTDIEQWITSSSNVPAMGFDAIAAAYLGGLNPIGAIFSSFFIKHITLGGSYIDKTFFSAQTADLIVSFIIYFCSFAQFFRFFMIKRYRKKNLKNIEPDFKETVKEKGEKENAVVG